MIESIIFALFSAGILWFSWPSLRRPRSHGFFRFFAFEATLGLILLNLRDWFRAPFSWHQLISWVLLVSSLLLVIHGFYLLRRIGRPVGDFEQTTHLVRVGAYRYIRHPLYASLLYLAWGVFFKSPSLLDGLLAVLATTFLYATARVEEAENVARFGQEYAEYMHSTRRFVPFVF
jgi:protein-S-isoprenylcysteine O-methyltransferase Ste14